MNAPTPVSRLPSMGILCLLAPSPSRLRPSSCCRPLGGEVRTSQWMVQQLIPSPTTHARMPRMPLCQDIQIPTLPRHVRYEHFFPPPSYVPRHPIPSQPIRSHADAYERTAISPFNFKSAIGVEGRTGGGRAAELDCSKMDRKGCISQQAIDTGSSQSALGFSVSTQDRSPWKRSLSSPDHALPNPATNLYAPVRPC